MTVRGGNKEPRVAAGAARAAGRGRGEGSFVRRPADQPQPRGAPGRAHGRDRQHGARARGRGGDGRARGAAGAGRRADGKRRVRRARVPERRRFHSHVRDHVAPPESRVRAHPVRSKHAGVLRGERHNMHRADEGAPRPALRAPRPTQTVSRDGRRCLGRAAARLRTHMQDRWQGAACPPFLRAGGREGGSIQ